MAVSYQIFLNKHLLKLINLLTLGFEFYIIKKLICRRDGIGRRAGLKIQSWRQGAGSTPAAGTKGCFRTALLFF